MIKLAIVSTRKEKKGVVELPAQFREEVREDLIARAVRALQANARQPYGADPMAGKRASAELSRRRRNYRGSYGRGISRVPRKILTRRGTQMYLVGAFAPGTVGGRRAHPPKAEKSRAQKINERENRKAIRSALRAVVERAIVEERGHKVPTDYPFIITKEFELLAKTGEVKACLETLGFRDELARAEPTKVRAGKGKARGRRTKRATSLLIVTSGDAPVLRGAANIPGVSAVPVHALNASLLAPGTHPGRAALFTEGAIERLAKESLFLDKRKPITSSANLERAGRAGEGGKAVPGKSGKSSGGGRATPAAGRAGASEEGVSAA